MKLIEALEILKQTPPSDAPRMGVLLACGFTPLHLQTFLAAHLRAKLPSHQISISSGLFGDLVGNIQRMDPDNVQALAIVIEWMDLDPRLGIRSLGGWTPATVADIVESAEQRAERLEQTLVQVGRITPTVVCLPTLPLPPLFWTPPDLAGNLELRLRKIVASLAASVAEEHRVSVANSQLVDETSPLNQRFDVKSEITSGFPYTLRHASVVGDILASSISNRVPKKGLITDLDNTLWSGVLGDDGIDGVSWHLDRGTHMHGLYQQVVASLAGSGVLVGVASKNDSELVSQVFRKTDLLLPAKDIFPFEVNWGPKSESVRRILESWNVAADSVVFVDDSPMELAEVKSAFPTMECISFRGNDYQGTLDVLKRLRLLFGKSSITEDDSLRTASIRTTSAWKKSITSNHGSSEELLRAAEASIVFTLSRDGNDSRSLELINKTNQFNLNGNRLTAGEWTSIFGSPDTILLSASYTDKYGILGKIAAVVGKLHERKLCVRSWVMSCRAFSRRIEHQCLSYLFASLDIDEIVFEYKETPRNGPFRDFLTGMLGTPIHFFPSLSRQQFITGAPALFHRVEGTINV